MSSTVSFPTLLQAFFTRRLMQQRQASPHTIGSYRDTFRLLLQFVQAKVGQPPSQLAFERLDAPLIAEFLNDLEKTRGSTARSRNLRLTAIRSFFRYAFFEAPDHAAQIQRVLAIPSAGGAPQRHHPLCQRLTSDQRHRLGLFAGQIYPRLSLQPPRPNQPCYTSLVDSISAVKRSISACVKPSPATLGRLQS